jgi:hypothetical protein
MTSPEVQELIKEYRHLFWYTSEDKKPESVIGQIPASYFREQINSDFNNLAADLFVLPFFVSCQGVEVLVLRCSLVKVSKRFETNGLHYFTTTIFTTTVEPMDFNFTR